MADQKITELNAITGVNIDSNDKFVIVDLSDNETKRLDASELISFIESAISFYNTRTLLANGAVGDGITDDSTVIDAQAVTDVAVDLLGLTYLYSGTFNPAEGNRFFNGYIQDDNTLHNFTVMTSDNYKDLIMRAGSDIRLEGDTTGHAVIRKNSSSGRDELLIYANEDDFGEGSAGSGIHLYGLNDPQHPGMLAFLTGEADQGDAFGILSKAGQWYFGDNIYDYADANEGRGHVNIKDSHVGNDTGRLGLSIHYDAISTNNASVLPQTGIEMFWEEETQDLGEGEGMAIDWGVRKVGDSNPTTVVQIASYKATTADIDATSHLDVNLSPDGSSAVELHTRFKAGGGIVFPPLASDPSGGEAGEVYYNTTSNSFRVHDGTSWGNL